MAYIARTDGEHLVIPSYRDVISIKQKNNLKKEILLLSKNHGQYITLNRKKSAQYEIAFANEKGYSLGETAWDYFKKPKDLIYCEAVPNSFDAILVIVKDNSVYLDGKFSIDSISEELVVFLTQQNNFEIYIHGDVPISETTEAGKFSFATNAVKTFKILPRPVFDNLPLLKNYKFNLVDTVLSENQIGTFPLAKIIAMVVTTLALLLAYYYFTASTKPTTLAEVVLPDPYVPYYAALTTPSPSDAFINLKNIIALSLTIPGWKPIEFTALNGTCIVNVVSIGGSVSLLLKWAEQNHVFVNMDKHGYFISITQPLTPRTKPTQIYNLKNIFALFIDRLNTIYPGNHLSIKDTVNIDANPNAFSTEVVTIDVNFSWLLLANLAEQCRNLPFQLTSINVKFDQGMLTGTINFNALGK